jgi:hypothetical protein
MGGGTGIPGASGNFVPGLGFTGGTLPGGITQNSAGRWIGSNGRFVSNATVVSAQQQQQAMAGRNMRIGGGLAIGGMVLSGIASGMDEGGGKTAVSALGGAAYGAAMGAVFGPIGMGIGAAAGALWSLYNSEKEAEARREAKEAEQRAKDAEENKKYKDMLEALSVKPLQLNVGNESLAKFSTHQNLTNSNPNYS